MKGKNHGNIYQKKKEVWAKTIAIQEVEGLFVHELKMFE